MEKEHNFIKELNNIFVEKALQYILYNYYKTNYIAYIAYNDTTEEFINLKVISLDNHSEKISIQINGSDYSTIYENYYIYTNKNKIHRLNLLTNTTDSIIFNCNVYNDKSILCYKHFIIFSSKNQSAYLYDIDQHKIKLIPSQKEQIEEIMIHNKLILTRCKTSITIRSINDLTILCEIKIGKYDENKLFINNNYLFVNDKMSPRVNIYELTNYKIINKLDTCNNIDGIFHHNDKIITWDSTGINIWSNDNFSELSYIDYDEYSPCRFACSYKDYLITFHSDEIIFQSIDGTQIKIINISIPYDENIVIHNNYLIIDRRTIINLDDLDANVINLDLYIDGDIDEDVIIKNNTIIVKSGMFLRFYNMTGHKIYEIKTPMISVFDY